MGNGRSLPRTVLRDTRERRPWEFRPFDVEVRDETIATGDYAVAAHCSRDPSTGTYRPRFAIERKTCQDFLTAITWERDRFVAELERAADWPQPLSVVVETSWERLLRNEDCMRWRDVHPNQIVGTVDAWARHYNVEFRFADGRDRAEQCGFLLLARHSLAADLGR